MPVNSSEQGVRHTFITVGPKTVLHPFQLLGPEHGPPAPSPMFQQGRLAHEVMLERPEGIDPEKLKRENWTTVEL